jgi:hypothetical protein
VYAGTTHVALLLDADGLVPPAAFHDLLPGPSYLVFAQQTDARIDVAAWRAHAQRFFDSDLHLAMPKRYGAAPPAIDGAHLALSPRRGDAIHRVVVLRPRAADDLAAAEAARGGAGLAALARRCPTVLLVKLEADPDRAALLLAALLSGVSLGPILTPDRARILGARTARTEAEAS